MKNKYVILLFSIVSILIFGACSEKWDEHYTQQKTVLIDSGVEISDLTVQNYIQSNSDLEKISDLFDQENIYTTMDDKDQSFTAFVYDNSQMENAKYDDPTFFAQTCICDLALTPSKLGNLSSILVWNDKYLAIEIGDTTENSNIYIAQSNVTKIVQLANGYVYHLEKPVYAPKSLYEYFEGLGSDYSKFKQLVKSFEINEFDIENSTPVGVDETGNTIYDSIFITKNTLMDRYDSNGNEIWTMRSEYYNSTFLIPSNDLIDAALEEAYTNVKESLGRQPTLEDSTKFLDWIVKACFYSNVYSVEDMEGENDLTSVWGYLEEATAPTDGTQWRPSVQKVNTAEPVTLSNGIAYYITKLKIPNNVVIFRIKSRFFYWSYCTSGEKEEYFNWINMKDKADIRDDGSFGPIEEWPAVYYKTLRNYPDSTAIDNVCGLEVTGILLDKDGKVSVAEVPPGEYYLRMGFRESMSYFKLDVYLNEVLVAEQFNPKTAHYDRTGVGFPYGYNYRDYTDITKKAKYYDCDGRDVATVTITGEGNQKVKLKMTTSDITSSTVTKEMVYYCWTLRPTDNNY